MPPASSITIRSLRPTDPSDRAALDDICVRTGHAGGDATGHYRQPDVIPAIYATPYAVLEPELVFLADDGERPVGYVLGTVDSFRYFRRFRQEWLPTVADRFPAPNGPPRDGDERLRERLHHVEQMLVPEIAQRYPAHLHIDILPGGQGRGLGRRLMATFLDALRARGVPGVHLGMSPTNTRARVFYERLGFAELPLPSGSAGGTLYLGRRLD